MKLISVAAVGLAIVLGGSGEERVGRAETWTQIRAGSVWTLDVLVKETMGPHEWACELARFTVRRDGKFIHAAGSLDGGRFAGMKYNFGGATHLRVEDLRPEAGVGWIVYLAESCGNAYSSRACVITPNDRDTYDALIVRVKAGLTQRVGPDGVELWGTYHEYGGGGTSTSIYVPYCLIAAPGRRAARRPLPSDPEAMVGMVDSVGSWGVLIAGFREENPDLMQNTLDRWFVEPEEEEYRDEGFRIVGLGLPARRADLQRMIENVRVIVAARAALQKAAGPIDLEEPGVVAFPN